MSEIKPVYQAKKLDEIAWADVTFESYKDCLLAQTILETRILYPAAAYEAIQKENAKLNEAIKKQSNAVNAFYEARNSEDKNRDEEIIRLCSLDADNKGLKECNAILTDENAAQAKRIAELENDLVEWNEFKKIRDAQMQALRNQARIFKK